MSKRQRLGWCTALLVMSGTALYLYSGEGNTHPTSTSTISPPLTAVGQTLSSKTATPLGAATSTRAAKGNTATASQVKAANLAEAKPANADSSEAAKEKRNPYAFTAKEMDAMRELARQSQPALRGMNPQHAMRRFRTARNLWATNPRLNSEQVQDRVAALARAFWGPEAQVPEETDADRAEQKRLIELQDNLKAEADALRHQDQSEEETRETVHRLLDSYFAQAELPSNQTP